MGQAHYSNNPDSRATVKSGQREYLSKMSAELRRIRVKYVRYVLKNGTIALYQIFSLVIYLNQLKNDSSFVLHLIVIVS